MDSGPQKDRKRHLSADFTDSHRFFFASDTPVFSTALQFFDAIALTKKQKCRIFSWFPGLLIPFFCYF